MPKITWAKLFGPALIALILFAFGAAAWLIRDGTRLETAYQQYAKTKADNYTDRARKAIERRCVPLPPTDEARCVREEDQAARQGRHDEYDLQAQLVTSAWTRQMGLAAIIAMAFGVLGVGLVFVTFRETRKAAQSARDTLDAFIAVERAHIVPTILTGTRDGDLIKFGLQVRNIGRSSAYLYHVRFAASADMYPPKEFKGYGRLAQTIKDGGELAFSQAMSHPGDIAALPFIGGYVEFESRFRKTHKAYFCFELRMTDPKELAYGGPEFYTLPAKPEQYWPDDT